jgi:hypothetical protein
MVYVETALNKCPSCNCAVDSHIMHLTSLLGPGAVKCHWCGTTVQTDRMEWWEMGTQAKTWFFGFSLLYTVLAFFLGGLSTNTALHFLETGRWRDEWGIAEPAFLIGGSAWASLVILVQLYRIRCSVKRNQESTNEPLRGSLLSFQVGGQVKFLLLILIVPAVCWLVHLVTVKMR